MSVNLAKKHKGDFKLKILQRFAHQLAALAFGSFALSAFDFPAGHFPKGGFRFYGRTNGASRKRKTNRLHLSRKTRNKHR